MKKKLIFTIALVLATAMSTLVSGCGDENPVDDPDEKVENYYSVRLEGGKLDEPMEMAIQYPHEFNDSTWKINAHMPTYFVELKLNARTLRKGVNVLGGDHIGIYLNENRDSTYTTQSPSIGGRCTITKYTKSAIVGTFEFYAKNTASNSQVHVVDGKFSFDLTN